MPDGKETASGTVTAAEGAAEATQARPLRYQVAFFVTALVAPLSGEDVLPGLVYVWQDEAP
jgi:hypothetical protein